MGITRCNHIAMHLHLVSFNVPYPPDYGGIIDVFYKIKALHDAGVKIHLHCFSYGRGKANELKQYCASVNYYQRKLQSHKQFSLIPFIVYTRKSRELIENLNRDDYPIIFEGLHCTYPLYINTFGDRKIVIRTHNIEHEYYKGLALSEKNLLKKFYFRFEALKLKHYEPILRKATAIAAISPNDKDYFKIINPQTSLVLPFHPFSAVSSKIGCGNYILIHGDLSVPENIQSVIWLMENIIPECPYPFKIAGKDPSIHIYRSAYSLKNVEIIPNPNDSKITDLIENAQINIVHSLYPQGFKLKLLHVLYKGRHCICNEDVVQNTELEPICHIANTSQEFISAIKHLMSVDFNYEMVEIRISMLSRFSSHTQTNKLLELIS